MAACSKPVAVQPPDPDLRAADACASFVTALPEELSTVGARRAVDPPSELATAYGDPPVAVRCGVPTPTALTSTSTLVTVEGIDWFPEELTGGWLMTTVGLDVNLEITVPTEQGPAPSVAADLAPTITATLAQP